MELDTYFELLVGATLLFQGWLLYLIFSEEKKR